MLGVGTNPTDVWVFTVNTECPFLWSCHDLPLLLHRSFPRLADFSCSWRCSGWSLALVLGGAVAKIQAGCVGIITELLERLCWDPGNPGVVWVSYTIYFQLILHSAKETNPERQFLTEHGFLFCCLFIIFLSPVFQTSFYGRFRHFLDIIDPRTLFVTEVMCTPLFGAGLVISQLEMKNNLCCEQQQ